MLGRTDIGSLEPGKSADFFTLDLNAITYSGGLSDPVAAIVFCAPTSARHTVVGGRLIVDNGEVVTIDMGRSYRRTIVTPRIPRKAEAWRLRSDHEGVALNLNTVAEVEGSVVRRRNCPSGAMATRLPRHKCGNSRICPPPSWLVCKPKN